MFGGETLHELRVSLQIAETERRGVSIRTCLLCQYYACEAVKEFLIPDIYACVLQVWCPT